MVFLFCCNLWVNVCSKLLASDDNGSANAYPVGYVHVTLCDVVSGIRVGLSCFSMRIAVTSSSCLYYCFCTQYAFHQLVIQNRLYYAICCVQIRVFWALFCISDICSLEFIEKYKLWIWININCCHNCAVSNNSTVLFMFQTNFHTLYVFYWSQLWETAMSFMLIRKMLKTYWIGRIRVTCLLKFHLNQHESYYKILRELICYVLMFLTCFSVCSFGVFLMMM